VASGQKQPSCSPRPVLSFVPKETSLIRVRVNTCCVLECPGCVLEKTAITYWNTPSLLITDSEMYVSLRKTC
jgi:hypothetical protein